MKPAPPAVTVVIVNYNGGPFMTPCLESLPSGVETVLVDNGSTDGSADAALARWPSIIVLRNAANTGFARAVNQGIERASGRYVCLLNNDARLEPDTLSILSGYLDANPDVGMVTPQLYKPDGSRRHSFSEFPSLASAFVNKSLLRLAAPDTFPSKNQVFTEPREVDALIGACMMVRKELVRRIGPLDEGYFLFLEETDWCLRARRAGWRMMLVPAAKAVHILGATRQLVRVRARIEYTRSLFRYFRRVRPMSTPFLRVFFPIRSAIEFAFQTLGVFLPKVRRRWQETAAVLAWQICFTPRSWGLSPNIDPKVLTLRDGTRVVEEHGEAFNDFDGKRRNARTLKDLKWKRTLLYPAGGRSYFIKIYKGPTWTKRLKNLLLGSRARHEWDMSERVRHLGIPQAPVIAMREAGSEAWVAVEKLEGWTDLQETLLAASDRRRLCFEYGKFARRLHDAGIWQYDFNPTNILVQDGEFRLIDFERMKIHPAAVPLAKRLQSLGKMNRIPSISRTDRLRFLKGYLSAVVVEAKAWKEAAREILRLYEAQIVHDLDRSERRCLDENRDFGAFEIGEWRGHYRKQRVTLEEIRTIAEGAPEKYRLESVPDAIAAWQNANRKAKEGGPEPLAVVVKRSSPEGRIAFPRTSGAAGRTISGT